MTPVLWRAGWRHYQRHPWQALLAIVGIAMGVAVVVAVDLANQSARSAFTLSVERLSGSATHTIEGGPNGIPEGFMGKLLRAGIHRAAPVVSGYASVAGTTLELVGRDPVAELDFQRLPGRGDDSGIWQRLMLEAGTVLATPATAARLQLKPGDGFAATIGGRTTRLQLTGLLRPDHELDAQVFESLLICDIATAQEQLGMLGRLSRIDLHIGAADLDVVAALLPADAVISTANARTDVLQQMTGAFQTNLTAMSLLALLVGLFLIYNTMTFAVVQRRTLLGSLRALGVSRRELVQLILGEAVMLGALGTLLGLGLGVMLGEGLVQLVARTINDLYFVVNVSELRLNPQSLLLGCLLGIGATLGAALAPALAAAHTSPGLVMRRSQLESRQPRRTGLLALFGAVLAGLAALLIAPQAGLAIGFVALTLLIFGYVLAVPWFTRQLMAGLLRLGRQLMGTVARLAVRGVTASLSRTGVAVAALTVALSTGVGMGIMVDSFRGTVQSWLENHLRADIFISPPQSVSARLSAPMNEATRALILHHPAVAEHSNYRGVEINSSIGPVAMGVVQLASKSYAGYRLKEGNPDSVWRAFASDSVLVSEPLANRHRLHVGDQIELRTDSGLRPFPVAGIYFDYGSDRGLVLMSRNLYQQHWHDPVITSLGLYLRPGYASADVVETLREQTAGLQQLRIRSNADLRAASLRVFDRTFTITNVLRLLAMIVAFVGVLSALMALQMERTHEFSILRALGLTPLQLGSLLGLQTGLMGLAAGLFALPLGLAMAWILVHVINRRAFGWTLQFDIDSNIMLQGIALGVVAALLAGLYPALRIALRPPAAGLREE